MHFKRLKKLLSPVARMPGERRPRPIREQALLRFMAGHRIATVIDVGANTGQFAQSLRTTLAYRGRIISIEPLPDAFAQLQAKAAGDERWSALNFALGDADATLPINVSRNSVSSSFLSIRERCVRTVPSSAYIGRLEVPVRRLDSLPELRAAAAERCLLKIDAQGYEHRVLHGAESILDLLALLYVESSLVPLYEGEPLIEETIGFLRRKGFSPVDIARGFSDANTGQQLQANILFARV